jgi:MerR family transcriptional regulator/heat shock protein HspR
MTMRRSPDEPKKFDESLSTSAAAELVEVSARTLMRYEKLGLVVPRYKGKTRPFSAEDVKWLRCLRELIHGRKISIAALKKLLKSAPCRELKHCRHDEYTDCMKSSGSRRAGATGTRKSASRKRRINRAQD